MNTMKCSSAEEKTDRQTHRDGTNLQWIVFCFWRWCWRW